MSILPDELWLSVFHYATDNPGRRQWERSDGPLEIRPFESFHEEAEIQLSEEALHVKASICLVCSRWRILSFKFLFEDIRIRQGSFGLAGKLEQLVTPSSDVTFGTYVRRIIIPVDASAAWQKTLEVNARRILMASPNTLILCRRCQEKFKKRYPRRRNCIKGAIDDAQLPLLRRVDWNNSPVFYYGGQDVRGVPKFIWSMPRLEILSLSDQTQPSQFAMTKTFPWCPDEDESARNSLSLTTIHTLRLDCHSSHASFVKIWGPRLSSIHCLVLDQPQGDIFKNSSFSKCAPQLLVVEIAFRRPAYRHDIQLPSWPSVLESCPNIISFHSHVRFMPMYEAPLLSKNGSLKELKLLMQMKDIEDDLLELKKLGIFEAISRIIRDRAIFPLLRRIELHGSGWSLLYGESIADLQCCAKGSQVDLSFLATDL